jgi:cytosine/adenosine deaminase-related metal-dependent hydrolase
LIRRLDRHGLLGPRLTLAHGVWIDPEEIRQLGAAGANVATNAMSNLKLLNGIAPLRAYAQAGVNLAIGCDGCSCSDVQNMFQGMKAFAQFWALQGEAGETGAARAALHAATVGGARALGLEGKVGLLKPGYRADLSLIDLSDPSWRPFNNALLQLVYGEAGRGVRHVIVDGRVVVRDRVLLTADEASLTEKAEAARAAFEPQLHALAQTNARLTPALLDIFRRAGAYPLPFDRLRLR